MGEDQASGRPSRGTETTGAEPARRPRGRPRLAATDEAILAATISLLTDVGVGRTTTNAIVNRSGCSKSTIYRRWPTRDHLILDALRSVVQGRPDDIRDLLDLERQLGSTVHAAAHRAAGGFQSRLFRGVFPAIAGELLANSAIGNQFRDDIFVPIRAAAKVRLLEAMHRGEVDPTVDQDLVFDLVYGGILYRVLLGEPVNGDVVRALADLIMTGVADRGNRSDVS